MQLRIQDQYKKDVLSFCPDVEKDYSLVDGNQDYQVIIGTLDYLLSQKKSSSLVYQVAVVEQNECKNEKIIAAARNSTLEFIDSANLADVKILLSKISKVHEKTEQVKIVKSEIQKKRRELEELNRRLTSESEKKIEFLERSHLEETEKNQNEKSLLHFLDFIQSESVSDDFPEKLFRFIWKDLKKYGRIYTIGLSNENSSGKTKISFYDGIDESVSMASLNFSAGNISAQLAEIWGRPVGKILFWNLPDSSRPAHLFIEIVDRQANVEKINLYFNERLAVLSMYLDRWVIEKDIEIIVERWKHTFKSFSGFVHLIDENFMIYHSNYPYDRNLKGKKSCYEALAGRSSPCENCPVVKNKNTNFVLKNDLSVKTYFSQFKFQEKKYYFVIYEDTTKINQLHSQIIQTEKMSTLGRLGNHLAHELNNPLTGIKSYVQTILDDENMLNSLPSTAKSDLSEILKATIRCQKIIKNFIEFSQKKEPILEKVSFNEVLQNTLVLLKTALRNHRLFVDLKDELILANAHDLQQVLFNLIKNSCQAMKTAGSIKIFQEKQGAKIIYHVEDSGPGFDEKILKNIFQPFMTTKPQGEGTGLGLYLSKKLINNMQAEMQVSSSPKGAKISLIFDIV